MKLTQTIIAVLIFLFMGMYVVNTQVYAVLPDENPIRPVIDDGTGHSPSTKTLEDITKILFGNFFSLPSGDSDIIATPTPDPNATPTPTPDPNASPTPTGTPNNDLFYTAHTYPQNIILHAETCLANKDVYKEVERLTGLPGEIIAGIHAAEISCSPTHSCVSGRAIGTNEPDVRGNCTQADTGIGKPNPLPGGGCGFTNLLDSCVYGANHLIGKIDKIPSTTAELVMALSYYNGGGNSNCPKTPYKYCPPKSDGFDDIYPVNKYVEYEGDITHQLMYTVYCADYTTCCPLNDDTCEWPIREKEGVMPIAAILSKYF